MLTNSFNTLIHFTHRFVHIILETILQIRCYAHFIDKKTEAKVTERGQDHTVSKQSHDTA